MIVLNYVFTSGLARLCVAGLVLLLAGGCAALRQNRTPQSSFYSLDSAHDGAAPAANAAPASAPTLIINPPQAAAGFDSSRIIYVRQDHKIEYFALSEWVDSPARMLAPLMLAAIERSGAFRAVVLTPSAAIGGLRLDSEILRLQQDFSSTPGSVRLTLRAYIMDNTTRRVLGAREFDASVVVGSEDPYGGVIAANRAAQVVLDQLAGFCAEAAAQAVAPAPDSSSRIEVSPLWR